MNTITIHQKTLDEKHEVVSSYHILLFILCFVASAIGGTVSTLMSVYLPVAVREILGTTNGAELNKISGYINALFIFGWAFGGFTWGVISDRVGRKKALLYAITCYAIFTILTGFMSNWWGIVACRLLSGFGVGGVLVVSFTLLSEVWPDRSKSVFIGILSIAFPVGIFSAGLINYVVASWREGFLVGLVPLVLVFAGTAIMQESSKWKSQQKDNIKSKTNALFSKSNKEELIFGSLIFGTMLIGLWAIFSWLPTWVQSLIPDTDAQKERGLSMMLMGMGGLTGGFLSGWFANALGLRKAMMVCFAVCASLSFILFKTNTSFSGIIYIEIAILAFFFGISQGVLSAYIPQLFPTVIRATATGFCFNIGRLFTGSAVLFVGVLVATLGGYGNAIFIFSLVFVIGLLVVLFMKSKKKVVVTNKENKASVNLMYKKL